MRKAVPIGHEDLKTFIDRNLYYVDKTLMIRELLDEAASVTLLTRPRRFGKTLNLSMVRRFFEDERTMNGEKTDNSYIFDGLAISGCGEEYMRHCGQYPVINLSLKLAKQKNYELAYEELKKRISEEFERHQYILEGQLIPADKKEIYSLIMARADEESLYLDAIRFLSECLYRYHGKNAIILIDEYDVSLENAYLEGFYDEMSSFIRSLFESALKTNRFLEFGMITGCLRISRESIFTGLNNLQIHSILSGSYGDAFGFTEEDVKAMLDYYDISGSYGELKEWYDGYRFGNAEIYNPWSIVKYVSSVLAGDEIPTRAYWSNTSSNGIIRELVDDADGETRRELEVLMEGGTIEKPIHEEITYADIHESQDNLWNFLFFTGYLKVGSQRKDGEDIYLQLSIPNREVKYVYRQSIRIWFDRKARGIDKRPLIKALEEGDCRAAEDFISRQLMDTISYFDYAENYYHGFLTGLLSGTGDYEVLSNRESGTGRPDIILMEKKFMGRAMVLELKVAQSFHEMEEKCRQALAQIEEQNYGTPLEADGYRPILKYGICFFKKGCQVVGRT